MVGGGSKCPLWQRPFFSGARCGNGLFSSYKSPKFYLSFTILVSLILVKYPDRIGPVNTVLAGTVVPTVRYRYRGIQHNSIST